MVYAGGPLKVHSSFDNDKAARIKVSVLSLFILCMLILSTVFLIKPVIRKKTADCIQRLSAHYEEDKKDELISYCQCQGKIEGSRIHLLLAKEPCKLPLSDSFIREGLKKIETQSKTKSDKVLE